MKRASDPSPPTPAKVASTCCAPRWTDLAISLQILPVLRIAIGHMPQPLDSPLPESAHPDSQPVSDVPVPAKRWWFGNVRWWVIAPLLIASTMLNHLNRNVLTQAAPLLKVKLGIDEIALSYIMMSFQSAY